MSETASSEKKSVLERKLSIPHNSERAELHWNLTKGKTVSVGFFGRHMINKSNRREILKNFMDRMKSQSIEDEEELSRKLQEYTIDDAPSNITTLRPRSPTSERKKIPFPETPTYKKYEIPPGSKCALCDGMFPIFREQEAIPCRVCDDVFHKSCLDKCGDLTDVDKRNIDKARTNIGWSCPHCVCYFYQFNFASYFNNLSFTESVDLAIRTHTEIYDSTTVIMNVSKRAPDATWEYNRFYDIVFIWYQRVAKSDLSLLLTTDEIKKMTEEFDAIDFNQDLEISLPEYISHFSRRQSLTNHRGQLLPEEHERVTRQFAFQDTNKDGKLDWWEFVSHEGKAHLARRDKYDLVALLTKKELCAAKATFNIIDRDGDGKIKEYELKDAFKSWYRQFEKFKPNFDQKVVKDSDILDLHANVFSQMIMDADYKKHGEVNWEDFILDQALYILCARPNTTI